LRSTTGSSSLCITNCGAAGFAAHAGADPDPFVLLSFDESAQAPLGCGDVFFKRINMRLFFLG
jgi:hypothetical protein